MANNLINALTLTQQIVKPIFLENIVVDPNQPRKSVDDNSILELAENIKKIGLIQPIIIRQHPQNETKFMVVAGERRFRAFVYLFKNSKTDEERKGWSKIEAKIVKYEGELNLKAKQYMENVMREDLNAIERAEGIKHLFDLLKKENPKFTWADLEKQIGIGETQRKKLMNLLDAPTEIKDAVKENKMSIKDFDKYKKLKNVEEKEKFIKDIKENKKPKIVNKEPNEIIAKRIITILKNKNKKDIKKILEIVMKSSF